ncbi:HD-GYP domain-containing protein [Longimicrobium sp.]|uniref:HD-GYP domain-containing protein n=1 Tax=Longimicrobium sp. TaxID=2029185 RepID=UPI002E35D7F2|nr:HD domain-containing phosphohydrolase [Longimicrobium sp.]HEX6041272.1 HD domain-containing phosphohydrolase [Longimicrobium sp.]
MILHEDDSSAPPANPHPSAESAPEDGDIRLSEVIAALSYALDLTEGAPEGHSVRTCLIGMRIAREIGLDADARSSLFYALLLKDAGCSANAAATCELFGADDHTVKQTWKATDWASGWRSFVHVVRNVRPGASLLAKARQVAGFAGAGPVGTELVRTRCERGADIARMLEMTDDTAAAIRALDEHWDGRGIPLGLAGEQIPLLARIAGLAQTVETYHSVFGFQAALGVARDRAGKWFDPDLVRALHSLRADGAFWAGLSDGDARARAAALEPADRVLTADEERLDRIAHAFARVIDAKSPFTFRHSEGVALYADAVARVLGFGPEALRDLRRAALLHDVGKLGVSNRILDKPGKLTEQEFSAVRRHPEHTYHILARVARFRPLAETAASHHERMDGRGYHRGLPAGELPVAARVLAVADVCDALSAERPYRGALPREQVLGIMRADAGPGLCPDCFHALETALERAPELGLDREKEAVV